MLGRFRPELLSPLQIQQVVRGAVGILGGAEDFVLVLAERFDPGLDVRSVLLRVVRDAALCGEEDAGQFGAEFLLGVVGIAETVAFVEGLAVQAVGMAAPVGQFVQRGSVVAAVLNAAPGGR